MARCQRCGNVMQQVPLSYTSNIAGSWWCPICSEQIYRIMDAYYRPMPSLFELQSTEEDDSPIITTVSPPATTQVDTGDTGKIN